MELNMRKLRLLLILALLCKAISPAGVTKVGMPKSGGVFTGAVSFSGVSYLGLKIQSMTTAERDALSSLYANGQIIYNTTAAEFQFRQNSAWTALGGGGGGSGTVTSVAMTVPSLLAVTGSPITTTGTLALTWTGLSQYDLIYASAANTPARLAIGAANYILGVNSTVTGYEFKNIIGTAGYINLSHTAGQIQLTTPQSTATTFQPTYAGALLSTGQTTLGTLLGTITARTATSFKLPVSAATTTTVSAIGHIGFDYDRLGTARGTMVYYDSTSRVNVLGWLDSETATAGDFPSYNSNGTFTLNPGVAVSVGLNSIPYFDAANTSMASGPSWDNTNKRIQGNWGISSGTSGVENGAALDTLGVDLRTSLFAIKLAIQTTQVFGVDTTGLISGAGLKPISGALAMGSAATTNMQFTTDATGNGEIVLPDASIGTLEIGDNTVTEAKLSSSDTFVDDDIVTLSGTTDFEYKSPAELGIWQARYRTADTTITNATLGVTTNVAGKAGNLWFDVTSGSRYEFRARLIVQTDFATTTGFKTSLTASAAVTSLAARVDAPPTAGDGASGLFTGWISASDDSVTSGGVEVVDTDYILEISGTVVPSATGVIQLRFVSEITGGGNQAILKNGSFIQWRKF